MKYKIFIAVAVALAALLIACKVQAGMWYYTTYILNGSNSKKVETKEVKSPEQIELERRQEVWISALEWCESKGKNSALNPKDRDGTPSYSNFQWKPSTLLYYGKMYELIDENKTLTDVPELLKNYELQRNIVRAMIQDPDVKWYIQFPECTKNKIGLPPKK